MYTTEFLDQEKAEYLLLNGYNAARSANSESVYFTDKHRNRQLWVHNDSLDVFELTSRTLTHSFTGISSLEIFEFFLLMHITGAVTMQEFIRAVKLANAKPLFDFTVADNGKITNITNL